MLFTIRVQQTPFAALAERPDVAAALARRLRAQPAALVAMNGLEGRVDPVVSWLDVRILDGVTRTIGELAEAAGVAVDTVRFYERRGLLPAPPRTASGYRQYDDDALDRLRFILRAKELGFTLAEIDGLMPARFTDRPLGRGGQDRGPRRRGRRAGPGPGPARGPGRHLRRGRHRHLRGALGA